MKLNKALLCLLAPLAYADVAVSGQDEANGFLEDSHLSLLNRNFYFRRDYEHGGVSGLGRNAVKPVDRRSDYSEEWAQGLMIDYTSGYTQGTVGVGVDAYSFTGIKLDSGGGRTGLRLMPLDSDGHPEDSFSKTGGSVKLRISDTVLKYGNLFPAVPVFWVNQVRLFPSSATGFMLASDEVKKLHLDAGHFTAKGSVDSSNNDDDLALDYGLPIAIRSVSYLGGIYRPNERLSLSLYGSELKDVWHQYYGNANYTLPLGDKQSFTLDANVYHTRDTGKQLASTIDNTTWSLLATYKLGGHAFSAGYQRVDSDEPMDWIGFGTMGGGVALANAVQYATFTEANERSWQLRYELNMAAYGVPGLTFMTRYLRGDHIDNADSRNTYYTSRYRYPEGSDPRHWERDIEARYVVQSGKAKDLSFRLRNAVHRASTGYRYADINEVRLIIDYPINVF
ncbi:OprD family porin [Pseudomonas mangiferae]|uniref:OprD family porin n=1 Tax=Pseudomonas mangiferae TaxID=2593654 RepID=A0A553H4J4_9PSED|nr:OprD family porin [Pseudomonas mangiferae]TRX76614.1 OprD family porin [Pseudomonas mangiferae]